MGGACCVAVRDKDVIHNNRSGSRGAGEVLLHRDVGCSPTWSFQWGNNGRRLVGGQVEDASDGVKGGLGSDRGVFYDAASPPEGSFGTPFSIKSLDHDGIEINRTGLYSELSVGGGYPTEVKNLTEIREIADLSATKLSYSPDSSFSTPVDDHLPSSAHPLPPNSTPSRRARRSPGHRLSRQISDSRILGLNSPNGYSLSERRSSFVLSTATKLSYSPDSSFSTPVDDHLPSSAHPLPPKSTPSRRARRSPGHRLSRQISDSRILGLNSPDGYSLSEGRSSFVLSTGSHDLSMGSLGGSSDGWSMRTFLELVASSQRGRWSFDSEHFGSVFCITNECSSRFSHSPSLDPQMCAACSRLLTEKSMCSGQNDLPVVSVLVCGHLYHADCLETMTQEVDKYDPGCPICMGGEKLVSNMSRKPPLTTKAKLKLKSHKISRNRVIDLDSDPDEFRPNKNPIQEEALEMDPSSSAASSSTKPFLRRHFTFARKRRGLSKKS